MLRFRWLIRACICEDNQLSLQSNRRDLTDCLSTSLGKPLLPLSMLWICVTDLVSMLPAFFRPFEWQHLGCGLRGTPWTSSPRCFQSNDNWNYWRLVLFFSQGQYLFRMVAFATLTTLWRKGVSKIAAALNVVAVPLINQLILST